MYAISQFKLSVADITFLKKNAAMKAIANYLLTVTSKLDPNLHSTLKTLFSQSESHVGLVICERLVNMPVQVIPPMYRMLADEIKRAVADVCSQLLDFILPLLKLCDTQQEQYYFTHLIIVSRVYHLSEEEESSLASSASTRNASSKNSPKKTKKVKQLDSREQDTLARPPDGIYCFHPEDIILAKVDPLFVYRRLIL